MCMIVYALECRSPQKPDEGIRMELELKAVVSCLMELLETELCSSIRTVCYVFFVTESFYVALDVLELTT